MSHIINGDGKVWPCVIGGVVTGALLGLTASKLLAAKKKPSSITLSYFDGRGLAELPRTLLAVAGVDYTDKRYPLTLAEGDGPMVSRMQIEEMKADCRAGLLDANMGRLPILDVDGTKLGGSKAICRYISRTYGLMGASELEAAQIDNVCELVADVSDAFGKQADKDAWFTTSAQAGDEDRGNRQLAWYLSKLEKVLGKQGFAVGTSFSMADAVIYNKFADRATTKGLFGSTDSQPMGDAARLQSALEQHAPSLAKIVANFGKCPAMQAHLAKRAESTPWF